MKGRVWLALLLGAASMGVQAAEFVQPWEEYDKLVKTKGEVSAQGPNLFGDDVSLYSGSLSFTATDVSLPGNNKLQVALTRIFTVANHKAYQTSAMMADWEIDTPSISGTFAPDWITSSPTTPNNRCSISDVGTARPPTVYSELKPFVAEDYWHGLQANMPGGGEMMLVKAGVAKPSTGTYYWVTSGFTYFSCLSSIQNGPGEGFQAITADGTKYTFDFMGAYAEPSLKGAHPNDPEIPRLRRVLYATQVEDRFGNKVIYDYGETSHNQPARLRSITADDGTVGVRRQITLNYNGYGHVSSVSDGTHTWDYEYAYYTNPVQQSLSAVTLRGTSFRWTIDFAALFRAAIRYDKGQPGDPYRDCMNPGDPADATPVMGTITHPSGAVGQFTVAITRFGRSNVPRLCSGITTPTNDPNDDVSYYPVTWDAFALVNKRISGPGLLVGDWHYTYRNDVGSFAGGSPVCSNGVCQPACIADACAGSTWVEVDAPGSWTRYTFGNSYRYNEGKLLKVEVGNGPTDIFRTDTTTYVLDPSGQAYPAQIGTSPQPRSDGFTSEFLLPQKATTVTQGGATFGSVVNTFDASFGRPLSVTKSSSLGYSRTDITAYHDNLSKWVLGQIDSVTTDVLSGPDVVTNKTEYDPNNALPWKMYGPGTTATPGVLKQTLTYDVTSLLDSGQRGTLKTFTDARNNVTTLTNWKRGIPQSIKYPITEESPAGAAESAVVNNDGTIASVADENGYATSYLYDAMGRISEISYPTGDSVAWNKTLQNFAATGGAEYGLPIGHWKQTISTGNGYKVLHFDALWRPVVEETYDNTNASKKTDTLSLTVKRYDADGRLEFQSYPLSSLTNYLDVTLPGTHTTYDALDRVRTVKQDSELGVLTTETTYENGFKTVIKNPRNFLTTTNYMAFDQPTMDWPIAIAHPEGAYTEIDRDVFGKPLSVTRSNLSGPESVTRTYVYDANQQLCKSIEPETGATVMHYDAAGNLDWSAAGLATLTSTTSCQDTDPSVAPRKVTRSYDARNRLKTLTFPDGLGNQTWTYTPDGLADTITTYNGASLTLPVINAYHYNRRRMLDGQGESISQPGWYTWGIGYGYDANGHLASHAYPNNFTVTYVPNALGQPTQVGTFATNVSYWPNGAVKQFTYGNLITHTLTQNTRGLPTTSCDAYVTCGSSAVLRDTYAYDPNGNVLTITDGIGTAQRGNRTMTYDGLDRLKTAMSPMFSAIGPDRTARYEYDALDNLTHVIAPGRSHQYCYNAEWQLDFIREGTSCTSGFAVSTLEYDLQGNLETKNNQGYVFDYGNRLRAVTGLDHYRYDGHGRRVLAWSAQGLGNIVSQYSSTGQLMYQYDQRRAKYFGYMYLGSSLVAIGEQPVAGGAVTIKYQHTDALGSPVAVTDASRLKVEYNEYEPYGKVLVPAAAHDGPGYTGHEYDSLTGLNYMQQRYYDPSIGRFLSVDEVKVDGKTGGNFNRYWYGNDNPYRFKDPDGRQVVPNFVPPVRLPTDLAPMRTSAPTRHEPDRAEVADRLDKTSAAATGLALSLSVTPAAPAAPYVGGAATAMTGMALLIEPTPERAADLATFGMFKVAKLAVKGVVAADAAVDAAEATSDAKSVAEEFLEEAPVDQPDQEI